MRTAAADRLCVLHALAPAQYGGLEQVVRLLATGQQRAGHEVHVAAVIGPGDGAHAFVADARAAGVQVHPVMVAGRDYVREYRSIARLCGRLAPDVVHTHGYRSDVVDGLAARARGVPCVATVHGFTRHGWRTRAYEWLQRRSYRGFDAVVAVSRAQVPELVAAGAAPERVHCLPNAWSTDTPPLARNEARRVLGLDPSAFVIGWVGRVEHEKGPDLLIEALPHLQGAAGVAVSIVGDGGMTASLPQRAAASGWSGRVHWYGAHPAAGTLFRAFDVFVLSSRTEGTPMVLFEAMAAGVPIVAAAVGGVPDVVRATEALLVEPGRPELLAAAIDAVRSDPGAADERASAAERRLASAYGLDGWLEGYENIYLRIRTRVARRSA